MRLIATPRSHFSRKVRLLLDHLELDYELIDIGNVADNDQSVFHGNPAMGVPVLEDGDVWMPESDHIAQYIVKTYDPQDSYSVMISAVEQLNLRAVMNGIMANEVKIVLASRTGLEPEKYAYFQKAKTAISQGLEWLEQHIASFDAEEPGYQEFHLVSLWDHLELYEVVELTSTPLRRLCESISLRPLVAQSAPE